MPDPSRPPAPEVAALVDRARRRDPDAFRHLFHSHAVAVHRVVRRMVGARPDVEDLVQTTFVEAFRSLVAALFDIPPPPAEASRSIRSSNHCVAWTETGKNFDFAGDPTL